MLFGPITSLGIDAARTLLDTWNGEADRFRTAALKAREGEVPSLTLLEAMDDTLEGLAELISDIDRALERMAPGDQDRGRLFKMQVTALALGESVGRSRDLLDDHFAKVNSAAVSPLEHATTGAN